MRRWLWLHFTRDGREEQRAAEEYQAMLDRMDVEMSESRVRRDSGVRHDLDDVAREFGVTE